MRAAVLYEPKTDLRICQLPVPDPSYGQVLVKIHYAGLCHSQLMEIKGLRGHDPYLPHLLGHEGSGVVEKTGPGVTKVRKGDRVVLTWIKTQGEDPGGFVYQSDSGVVNSGPVTTFSDYSLVSENRLVKISDDIPMELAWLFGCALLTGCGIINNIVRPPPGSNMAIFGLGGIGTSALMAAKAFHPGLLIGIDIEEAKLKQALDLGATHIINSRDGEPLKKISELTKGRGLDFAIETSGLCKVIEDAFSAVRRQGGKVIFASHPAHGQKISIDPYELICGKQITGTWGGDADPEKDAPMLSELYNNGHLPLEKLRLKRFTLDEINEAFLALESRNYTRVYIDMMNEERPYEL